MRPRFDSNVTVASLVAAMLSLVLIRVEAQDPRPVAQFDGPGVHAQLHQGTNCPGDMDFLNVQVFNVRSAANQIVTYRAFAEPAGIIGFSWSADGPFADSLEIHVHLDANGNGQSEGFHARAMTSGTAQVNACSDVIGCVGNPFQTRVAAIDSVQLVAFDSPLDHNPNPGGGKRIYPGKTHATDAVDRRAVTVRAIIGEPIAGVPVHFASFDVDDPSHDSRPVDPNGAAGNDNRGQPRNGEITQATALTNAAGIAETTLRVGLQPGDNYRVAASCKSGYLDAVTVQGLELVDAEGQVLPSERADASEMLTVWRRLHVEVDSMGLVSGNTISGIVLGASARRFSSTTTVTLDLNEKLERQRFRGGLLEIPGMGSFYVVDNDAGSVTVDAALDNGAVAGRTFVLVDDDDHNDDDGILRLDGDEGENVRMPDLSFMSDAVDDGVCNGSGLNPFGAAYVCPAFDVGDDNDFVTFVSNSPTPPAVIATYDFDAIGTEQDPLFWTVYLLGAYQPESSHDADPGMERFILGRVDDVNGIGASIFQETIADGERTRGEFVLGCSNALTVVHEIGHLLNGRHPEGGLMASPCESMSIALSAKTIASIRNLIHP
jgi:hypothetical protein